MSRMFAMLFALSLGFASLMPVVAYAEGSHYQFAPPNQNEGNNS